MTDLAIVPSNPELIVCWQNLHRKLYGWDSARIPDPPKYGIWVVTADQYRFFVGGVGVYPTNGPYCLFENLLVNPTLSPRLRYQSILMMEQAARIYGAIVRKHVVGFPSHKGLCRMLQKLGWETTDVVTLHAQPAIIWRSNVNKAPPSSLSPP